MRTLRKTFHENTGGVGGSNKLYYLEHKLIVFYVCVCAFKYAIISNNVHRWQLLFAISWTILKFHLEKIESDLLNCAASIRTSNRKEQCLDNTTGAVKQASIFQYFFLWLLRKIIFQNLLFTVHKTPSFFAFKSNENGLLTHF